jgi:hypothetical protein
MSLHRTTGAPPTEAKSEAEIQANLRYARELGKKTQEQYEAQRKSAAEEKERAAKYEEWLTAQMERQKTRQKAHRGGRSTRRTRKARRTRRARR